MYHRHRSYGIILIMLMSSPLKPDLSAPRLKYIPSWAPMAGGVHLFQSRPNLFLQSDCISAWPCMYASIIVAKHCYTTEQPPVVNEYTFA